MTQPMVVQPPEMRFRKGAVILVRTSEGKFYLDRVVRSRPDSRVSRRVMESERLGPLYGEPYVMLNVYTLDKTIRARDLWNTLRYRQWENVEDARSEIEEFLA